MNCVPTVLCWPLYFHTFLFFCSHGTVVSCTIEVQWDTLLHTARHNKLRALHQNTPSLEMSEELNWGAQAWADHLANTQTFAHADSADRPNQGENLYTAWTSQLLTGDALKQWAISKSTDAVQSWYDEISDFNWDSPNDRNSHTQGRNSLSL